jgi:segregation and condensation protein B
MELNRDIIDEIDNAREAHNLKKVEAALFLSGKFMSIQELVALTGVNPILLKKILEDLKEEYNDSGVEIINKENLWKMDVSQDFTWMVNKLATGKSEFSKAEQETLAIIAYKQPMKQSVLVKIRGNKAYDHIKKYSEMGLVNKKKLGHTWELSLSESFYDYFSVNKSDELVKEAIGADGKKLLDESIVEAEREVENEEKEMSVNNGAEKNELD